MMFGKKIGKKAQVADLFADLFIAAPFLIIIFILAFVISAAHSIKVSENIISSEIKSVDTHISLQNILKSEYQAGKTITDLLRDSKKTGDYSLFETKIIDKINLLLYNKNSFQLFIENNKIGNEKYIENPDDSCKNKFVFVTQRKQEVESTVLVPMDDGTLIKVTLIRFICGEEK